jgi:hypothetical protein
MPKRKSALLTEVNQPEAPVAVADHDGGSAHAGAPALPASGERGLAPPRLTNAELVQLRIRVIALENLVIALLVEASERQLALVRDMAAYISPRPHRTHHPLTTRAATQMTDLVERARRFPEDKPSWTGI